MEKQGFNKAITENQIKSNGAQLDRAFLICNGITGIVFGGCASFTFLLLFNPYGQEISKNYPFLCFVAILIIVGTAVWVRRVIPSGEAPKTIGLNTLQMSCLSGTLFLLVSHTLSKNGLGFPPGKIDMTFASVMPWLGGIWYSSTVGYSIGNFIWLGGNYALFGCVNLALIYFVIDGASSPPQAFHYLLGLVICQFLLGVWMARFSVRNETALAVDKRAIHM